MPVAKSYITLAIEEGPYEVNGRQYCKVRQKNGSLKQIRWYTEAEYKKMYPEEKETAARPDLRVQHDILGFQKGYITIFKGDTYANQEWFEKSIARYCKFWGWYIVSTDELPTDLPHGIEPIRLPWELVGEDAGWLKPEHLIKTVIDSLIYEQSKSKFQGAIGDRLELDVTIIKSYANDNQYGKYTTHTFEDANGNQYIWATSAKTWEAGLKKHIRGTVKDHKTIRNVNTTILTRVIERN